MLNKIKNAFSEAYVILENLDKESYKKIPPDVIQTIKNNRNKDYIYSLNTEVSLESQTMLPETKALLSNIYRDYLANEEEKKEILKKQQEDRIKNEKEKQKNYNNNLFKEKKNSIKKDYLIKQEETSLLKRIVNRIKKILKIK